MAELSSTASQLREQTVDGTPQDTNEQTNLNPPVSDKSLCTTCQTLPLAQYTRLRPDEIPKDGLRVSSLGNLTAAAAAAKSISNSSNSILKDSPDSSSLTSTSVCAGCLFFAGARDRYHEAATYQLRAYNHGDLQMLHSEAANSKATATNTLGPAGVVFTVLQDHKRMSFHAQICHSQIVGGGLLVPVVDSQLDPDSEDFGAPGGEQAGLPMVTKVPDLIDWEVLQSWIRTCQTSHAGGCRRSHGGLGGGGDDDTAEDNDDDGSGVASGDNDVAATENTLRLYAIDCRTRTVVLLPSGTPYLALSYVWGRAHDSSGKVDPITEPDPVTTTDPSTQTLPNSWPYLPPKLPKTIADAITATLRLGQRYLWVDKYCISRHDSGALLLQIANMDQVYEGAVATIVALHGVDANAGLPGVSASTARRKNQPSLTVNGVQLLSTLPPLSEALEQSVWCSRGWTYQEGRLARRVLFFASTQVYFSCHSGTQSEAVRDDSSIASNPGRKAQRFASAVNQVTLGPGLFAAGERARATGNHFIDDRSSYTRRQLTFPGDILDAYRGLLRRSACHSFWGVSILPEYPSCTTAVTSIETTHDKPSSTAASHLGLAHGLIWLTNVRKPKARRPGFPTWSWTSVDGHVVSYSWRGALSPGGKYVGPAPNYSPSMRSSSVEFWIYDAVGTLRHLPDLLHSHSQQRDFLLPETSSALVVEGEFVTVHVLTPSAREQRQVRTMDRRRVVFCGSKASSACRGLHDGDAEEAVECDISLDCPDPVMTATSASASAGTDATESTSSPAPHTSGNPNPNTKAYLPHRQQHQHPPKANTKARAKASPNPSPNLNPPNHTPCTDALLLVSYAHERNRKLHGCVLLLLQWKAHNVAERVGLLRIEGPMAAGDLFRGVARVRRRVSLE